MLHLQYFSFKNYISYRYMFCQVMVTDRVANFWGKGLLAIFIYLFIYLFIFFIFFIYLFIYLFFFFFFWLCNCICWLYVTCWEEREVRIGSGSDCISSWVHLFTLKLTSNLAPTFRHPASIFIELIKYCVKILYLVISLKVAFYKTDCKQLK